MFELASLRYTEEDPWVLPVSERLFMFRRSPVKVAYFYTSPDSSTFRYRCYTMAQTLNENFDDVSASWFHAADKHHLATVARESDVIVICRTKYTAELAQFVLIARQNGARVLFDCDDLVFDPGSTAHIVQSVDGYETRNEIVLDDMWNLWFSYVGRIRASLMLTDGMIVTNPYLADRAHKTVDLPISVIPNFMSTEQADFSRELVRRRGYSGDRRDGCISLGYFSGTPTHNKDFALIGGALARLMDKNPQVRLRVVGYLELKGTVLAPFEKRIDWCAFTDYVNLQTLIAETEVNVAPLQDTRFTNCKSELKYFDAAAVAIPTLASPTYTMATAIEDNVTGMLVANDGWDAALDWIVNNYDTAGIEMGRAAYHVAHTKYVGKAQAGLIREVLDI